MTLRQKADEHPPATRLPVSGVPLMVATRPWSLCMWSYRAWRRRRLLARFPIDTALWQQVIDSLPLLDGLEPEALDRLRDRCVLFLHAK